MSAQVPFDAQTLAQLEQNGETQVVTSSGIPVVLMTVDTRQQLQKVQAESDDWSDAEQNAVMAEALNDPEGWGAPEMDVYDTKYGHLFDSDAEDQ